LEAAQAFTEALTLIESETDHSDPKKSSSLNKQIVTLINNRSAMYEKGSLPELALEDCSKILEVYDFVHTKARTRKLRLLENSNQFYPALVEVCALQLLFMQKHRDTLRMGIPPSVQPPVPQSKLEELIEKVLPEQMEAYAKIAEQKKKDMLPAGYTLMQLLKSYTGYNAWMAKAAKDGSIDKLKKELDGLPSSSDSIAVANRASVMMKIGRRYVYDGKYSLARHTLLDAYKLVEGKTEVQNIMSDDNYARLLEWTGMVKHWTYNLDAASQCYQECAALEPTNVSMIDYSCHPL
jgi:tetratricopeptide (TPR) repeat protein